MYIGNDLQVAESGNKIIDDISSSFNGSTTSFALTVGGYAPVPFPINTQQIYISVNGVLQEPDPSGSAGFKLLGTNIVFSSAPTSGHAFFGVILSGADYVTVGTEFPAGSATSPSITFGTDNDTGMYSVTSGQMGFTSNGVQTFTLDSDGFRFNDNKKLICGSGSDLNIYHNGTDSIIDNNTGELKLYASQFTVKSNNGGETQAVFAENGAVSLYHNNVVKAATTSGGINVTGTVTDDGATHDGDVTFTGDAANVIWDKSADDLIFNDNAKAAFGTSSDLSIFHDGTNSFLDSNTGSLKIQSAAGAYVEATEFKIYDEAASETIAEFIADGACNLYYDNSKTFETISGGATVTGQLYVTAELNLINGSTNAHRYIDAGLGDDNTLTIRGTSGGDASHETLATFTRNGSVSLYYDNSLQTKTTSTGLHLADSKRVDFGTSTDLQIYHDGTDSWIKNWTGKLKLTALSAENGIVINPNGAVELYYDNVKHFETTSAGCKVSTGHLDLDDSQNIRLGNSQDFLIYHNGSNSIINDNGTGNLELVTNGTKITFQGGSDTMANFIKDGGVELYYDNTLTCYTSNTCLSFPDSQKIFMGAGNDLQLYHDGTNNFLHAQDGDLNIGCETGHKVVIQNGSAGNHLAEFNYADSVELFHNGSRKFETNSTGVVITGGIYLDGSGGEAAANKLDDYEEGDWEPVVTPESGSFTSITMHGDTGAYYTKMGRQVYVMGCVRWTALDVGTASGNLEISLPFTPAGRSNGDNCDDVGAIRAPVWNGSNTPTMINVRQGSANCWFAAGTMGNDSVASGNGDTGGNGMIQFSVSFRTAT